MKCLQQIYVRSLFTTRIKFRDLSTALSKVIMQSDCQIQLSHHCLVQTMTPGDSWLLVSQRRENEGSSGVVGPSSSLGPSDYQEPLTSGDAGNKPVKTDQFEDVKILLQSPPQFRKEMQVLCMPRPHDIPEKFTLEFGVLDTDLDNISLWLRAPENLQCVFIVLPLCILILCVFPPSLGFSQARCISLVCYSFQDLRPHPIPQGESHNGLEVLWPVPWTKILPVSFSMNDEFTFMFPPYEVRLHCILGI